MQRAGAGGGGPACLVARGGVLGVYWQEGHHGGLGHQSAVVLRG